MLWDMEPMHSAEIPSLFDERERSLLLDLAQRSILHGLAKSAPLPIEPADYPMTLQQHRASFVTLNRFGKLRGCIGHLQAMQPLVADVAENAYSAAFRDPRFVPLDYSELTGLELHISVLSPPEAVAFESQSNLLERIRPGIDGLILKLGRQQGTFLPSVWESLPNAHSFLDQLKLKAGLPRDYWSDDIEIYRYQTESFGSSFNIVS